MEKQINLKLALKTEDKKQTLYDVVSGDIVAIKVNDIITTNNNFYEKLFIEKKVEQDFIEEFDIDFDKNLDYLKSLDILEKGYLYGEVEPDLNRLDISLNKTSHIVNDIDFIKNKISLTILNTKEGIFLKELLKHNLKNTLIVKPRIHNNIVYSFDIFKKDD